MEDQPLKRYRVWLIGSSLTASYDGYVDVWADDDEDAEYRAKARLTGPGGTFSDWSPGMFKTQRVERLRQ